VDTGLCDAGCDPAADDACVELWRETVAEDGDAFCFCCFDAGLPVAACFCDFVSFPADTGLPTTPARFSCFELLPDELRDDKSSSSAPYHITYQLYVSIQFTIYIFI